ncbi:MAG: hypothetical protein Q8J68_03960 [Methanolobus sp.]|uniref:hypothetical protein n=1 Tax=Methanolobus sp. TaxID=1874737 RepID=UPI002731DCF5|nr:hypothetical protein [Methanolobus sp.]MDP2216427.1 hypothetical protein [Methanolobus sp.]
MKKEKDNYFPFFAPQHDERHLPSWLVLVLSALDLIFDAASGVIFFVAIFISPFVSGLSSYSMLTSFT